MEAHVGAFHLRPELRQRGFPALFTAADHVHVRVLRRELLGRGVPDALVRASNEDVLARKVEPEGGVIEGLGARLCVVAWVE